jgi:hypothetical protein
MMLAATISKELHLDPWSMDMDQFNGALRLIAALRQGTGSTEEIVARMKAEREEDEL